MFITFIVCAFFYDETFPAGVVSYSPFENVIDVAQFSMYNRPTSLQTVDKMLYSKRCDDSYNTFVYLENAFSALSLHFLIYISANVVYVAFAFVCIWIFHRYQVDYSTKVIKVSSKKKKETIPSI